MKVSSLLLFFLALTYAPSKANAEGATIGIVTIAPMMLTAMGASDLATLGLNCVAANCESGPILQSIQDEKKADAILKETAADEVKNDFTNNTSASNTSTKL